MTQPGKVVVVIVQMIVKPLIGLRQERILKEKIRDECVINHRIGSGRELRIDWELRCKFGFSLALLDDGCEGAFGLRLVVRVAVASDVW